MNLIFLHPDLGIGGAERAVLDAALALKSCGHQVQFITTHHDPSHCFKETIDGTLKVTSVGDWLPRSVLNRFYALFAYIRMLYAALYLVFFSGEQYELVFCDQISACIPILKFSRAKVLFYCHFPDLLLTKRQSFLKKVYRAPLDWLEEKTTGMAHCVLVNSNFTAGIFKDTFKSLDNVRPQVLYPIPHVSAFNQPVQPPTNDLIPSKATTVFLSINRYERKKNLSLTLEGLGKLNTKLGHLDGIHLVIAGGYDERVVENKEYYMELRVQTEKMKLEDHVSYLRSVSDNQKLTLLKHSTCLLYTPDREHFGIVPVEAMYMKCPVIAVNSGGPVETVVHGETGYLCRPDPDDFANAMEKFVLDQALSERMGENGHQRVVEKFSFDAFTDQLNDIVTKCVVENSEELLKG